MHKCHIHIVVFHLPILVHNSPNILSGLAVGALVKEDKIKASHAIKLILSIEQG